MTISLPDDVALRLKERAGPEELTSYVSKLLTHFSAPPNSLDEISGSVQGRFLESGITEEELVDVLEKAKHEMRTDQPRSGGRL